MLDVEKRKEDIASSFEASTNVRIPAAYIAAAGRLPPTLYSHSKPTQLPWPYSSITAELGLLPPAWWRGESTARHSELILLIHPWPFSGGADLTFIFHPVLKNWHRRVVVPGSVPSGMREELKRCYQEV